MKPNRFRHICEQGKIPLGHMVMEFSTHGLAKILEATGIDFVVLDMEHTGLDSNDIADQIAWFKATTIAPFVRVPQTLYHFFARTMDVGALGVMAGNVETAEQARSIVQAVKYAPLGNRGVGLGTAHNDYTPPDPVAYFRESNENTTVICQIESTKGMANLDAIAATEGVDVLWVGHYDLTQSMGIPAQFHHPDFLAAVGSVIETAKRRGKRSAIQPGNAAQAAEWLDLGFNVISYGLDFAVYRDALRASIDALRQRIQTP
jgi:2-dehydro-3-deoxyglucarate aldolase/4-hydroxy-2-oxoheptanedioate aldolase